jgi:putative membrane-bound dehydrogenase-like protein
MNIRLALAFLAFTHWAAAAQFTFGDQTFTVPDGFTLERVAAPPLVDRPINMAFDEEGALYVTDSSGSNDRPAAQLQDPKNRIVRLQDRDGDGAFEASAVYADKLGFPEGTMWLNGSLYVSVPPQIWKFTDRNEDGVAEQREVWFDGKTLTGCGNDLHGPYAGPDGCIYWCKGAFAEQHHTLSDGREFITRASHVFRSRRDGSGLDVMMTGGMDNPVDLVFSPRGQMFVCGTFFVNPANGQRDGILHAVHGGVWGKQHDVLDGHPRTGDLMPIMTHLGPAAASGLEIPRSDALGLRGTLVCCQFNMHKVSRHVLTPDGATYRTTDTDLVTTSHADFHPTDVIEDADGSLLIADTGGWYRFCCPTSTIAKPAVLGAIYRLRKTDAPKIADPRGRQLVWPKAATKELVARLGDPRPVVVDRAMATLAERGDVAALSNPWPETVPARLAAVWTVARIQGTAARAANRAALRDRDADVAALAARNAALWRDRGAAGDLLALLTHEDAGVRREAAAALGVVGDARAISPLLAMAEKPLDRFAQHALAYALYELNDAARLPSDAPGPAGEVARIARQMLASPAKVKALPPLPMRPAVEAPPDPALTAQRAQRLEQLAAQLSTADAQRGADVFRSAKALCTTCHAIAGRGGTLGPDLTKIGAIRTERDLLEAIVFPSASFVRSYEPSLVKTAKGESYGILKADGPEEIVLATGPGTEAHIPRSDVREVQPGTVSLMPAGLDGILTPRELTDLVTYLRTAR